MRRYPPSPPRDPSAALLLKGAWTLGSALLLALLMWLAMMATDPARSLLPDLQVYLAAGVAAAQGHPLYVTGFTDRNLPWLYPPFAAVVLGPLSWLPEAGSKIVISLLSLASLVLICERSWRAADVPRPRRGPMALLSVAILLTSEPLQQNLMMGQINVVVTGIVLTDRLLPADHPARGYLVGLTAGIKLTPALFIVHDLMRRDWPAVGRATLGFLTTVFIGAVALPGDSVTYWAGALLSDRIGPAHLGNQSVLGALLRLGELAGADEGAIRWLWLILALSLGVGATWLVARSHLDALGRYCAIAAVILLVSPLSWTPHWIALAPLLIWLAARRRTLHGLLSMLMSLGLVWFVWPGDGILSGLVWIVHPEGFWPGAPPWVRVLGQVGLGMLYCWLGLVALVSLLRAGRVPHRAATKSPEAGR